MPDPLAHGDVVSCRQAVGVVWRAEGDELTVLPIGPGDGAQRRHKVPLDDLAHQSAAGIWGKGLIIHADMPTTIPGLVHRKLGRLPSELICECSKQMIRAHLNALHERKWLGGAEHGRVGGIDAHGIILRCPLRRWCGPARSC